MAEYPTPEDVRKLFLEQAGEEQEDMTIEILFDMLAKESHAASFRWFPETSVDLGHHTLAMCGEVGEVANIVKKMQRGDLEIAEGRQLLKGELSDVLIYLLNCAAICHINLGTEFLAKQKFNEERFNRG